jgi:phosphohistidine phosphatase
MIRHAKSSWSNPLQSDFERPLNDRGEHDAPMMGQRLKKLGIVPDCIVSSTAKRATQTAKRIAEGLGFDKEKIQYANKLYHCIPSVFAEVIQDTPDDVQTLCIVAHNPGMTDFANELSDHFRIDNMPTCSVVVAEVEAEEWPDFVNAPKKVILFEYPKKP